MDKRKEANMRVKSGITVALLNLMHRKNFSDITASEPGPGGRRRKGLFLPEL